MVALGIAADAAEVEQLARGVSSSEGVFCVPAFQGLGSPFGDAGATGWIGGLTRGSGRPQLARAVLEGIAQRVVDVAEALGVHDRVLAVDGGLARSDVLVQEIADLSGLELARASEVETTALGAALLAALGCEALVDLKACRARVPEARRFSPRREAGLRAEQRARWSAAVERARSDSG